MLCRIITIPKPNPPHVTSYTTEIVCTVCGHGNIGSSFKTEALVSMAMLKCFVCGEMLNNQELLNKKVEARLDYHNGK